MRIVGPAPLLFASLAALTTACSLDERGPDRGPAAPTSSPLTETLLFSDDFNRTTTTGLGASWAIAGGVWFVDGARAQTDSDANDLAIETPSSCRDCRVEASVLGFGVPEAGIVLRAQGQTASVDRYDLVLLSTGDLAVRRFHAGTSTTLGQVASGIADLGSPATISLAAAGASPVTLTISVGGVTKLTVTDAAPGALANAGWAGLRTTSAGVVFDDLHLYSTAPPPDMAAPADLAQAPDLATARDLSTPPDLAAPADMAAPADLARPADMPSVADMTGAVDMTATVDMSAPADLSSPPDMTATAPTLLFRDDFTRTTSSGLGASWSTLGAWFTDGSRAETDSDGTDRAVEQPAACRDCRVEASVLGFGVPEIGVALRAQSQSASAATSRYDLVLRGDGTLLLRRVLAGVATSLGTVASGIADLGSPATLSLAASGSAPVVLTVAVNGATRLTVSDAAPGALASAGWAGMVSTSAGVVFDAFQLWTVGSSGGTTDGGAPADMSAPPDLSSPPDLASGGANPIVVENQLAGDPGWDLTQPSRPSNRDVEGYASVTSAAPGDTVAIHVSTAVSTTTRLLVYRIGDYGGAGARLVATFGPFATSPQPMPAPDPSTHVVECTWPTSFSLPVGGSWTSGVYLLKLVAATGYQAWVPLVVRDGRAADLLFLLSMNTWQAYNYWGGWSLYGHPNGDGTFSPQLPAATRVSFDRPFGTELAGDTFYDTTGAGLFPLWDIYTVRWLERQGYDVTYATDIDLHAGAIFDGHKGAIIGAHDEYWSSEMRTNAVSAIGRGVSVSLLGANEAYWKVRIEPSTTTATPNRIVTCYKDQPGDPFAQTNDTSSITWRNFGLPEQQWEGQMYDEHGNVPPTPMVIARSSHWTLAGTGLTTGSSIPDVVGYEFDRAQPSYPLPSGLEVIAASPTEWGVCSNMTLYFASSGAQVFSAGTIDWAWGIGKPGTADARIATITKNVVDNMLTHAHGPTPSAQGIPPCP